MNYFKKLCPSGRGKNKLRGIQFTADQRQWMGVAMIAGQFTPSIASLTFNLKAPQLKKYAAKILKQNEHKKNACATVLRTSTQ